MDLTVSFSEDDDSLQTRSLQEKIHRISRQLTCESSASSQLNHVINTSSPNSTIPLCSSGMEQIPLVDRTLELQTSQRSSECFEWNDHLFSFTPEQCQNLLAFTSIVKNRTPIFRPPINFRDTNDYQEEPFDLSTTDTALDLRIQPLALTREAAEPPSSSNDEESPLQLTKTNSKPLPDISTQDVESDSYITSFNDTSESSHHILSSPSMYKTKSHPVNSPKTGHPTNNRKSTSTSTITSVNNATVDVEAVSPKEKTMTGRKASTSPKRTHDVDESVSTSVIIDNAFHYLKDVSEESNQSKIEKRPDLNLTYDISRPVGWDRKPPSGVSRTTVMTSTRNDILKDNVSSKHSDLKEGMNSNLYENKNLNERELPTLLEEDESSDLILSSNSSSFTSVTSLASDATKSVWSVKSAVSSLTSSLTLTLTKTPAHSNTVKSKDDSHTPLLNSKSRIVVGSNNSTAEIASSIMASNVSETQFVSFPATPDVSLCQTSRNISVEANEKSNKKLLSSTPRETRQPPIGIEIKTTPKAKKESLRTTILKKVASAKRDPDSESVLNVAFRQEAPKSSP